VGSMECLAAMAYRKKSLHCPFREPNPGRPARRLVTMLAMLHRHEDMMTDHKHGYSETFPCIKYYKRFDDTNVLLTHSLTHSLTPWCRILFEKLTVTQLVKT
jgi:hypothetical protein